MNDDEEPVDGIDYLTQLQGGIEDGDSHFERFVDMPSNTGVIDLKQVAGVMPHPALANMSRVLANGEMWNVMAPYAELVPRWKRVLREC